MVFDPRTDNEAIHGSLSGDIADIYRDLKDGIVLKETNEVPLPKPYSSGALDSLLGADHTFFLLQRFDSVRRSRRGKSGHQS